MKYRQIKLATLVSISLFASACSEGPKEVKAPEPVDIQATEQINDKLLNAMREISDQQLNQLENAGKETLTQLAEADRQSLINLTIDESAEAVAEDAKKMVDLLEGINRISE